MNNSLAPIILFVYNRPWHTEQTLEALMNNELADQSKLYVFCDGPKKGASEEELDPISKVRTLIYKKKWCKEVIIHERDNNLGLANSVIRGVTEVIEKEERIIVLEDDIITGKHFLEFMNEGLSVYENEKQVFGVSGYCFPSSKKIKEKTFFLPVMSSWGYGTWKDRWEKINFNGVDLLNKISRKEIGKNLNFSSIDYHQMLKDQVLGKNDSWAVRFYASMYLNNGVFLYPNFPLLKNIGFDGSGVHCKSEPSKFNNGSFNSNLEIPVKRKNVSVKRKNFQKFMTEDPRKKQSYSLIKRNIRKFIAPEIIQFIKRKTNFSKKENQELSKLPRYTKTTVKVNGKEIKIPDNASFLFMYKEIFEEEIYNFITSNPNPYIIDGGANIGLSIIYFKNLYPRAKIIGFEPDPLIFEILKDNIDVFDLENVELIPKGLWSENMELDFWSEGADAGLVTDLNKEKSPSVKIKTTSLTKFLERPVDLLKLDIEGAETIVLKDIEDKLYNVEKIFVEYHSFAGQSQSLNEIINILTKAKFRLYMCIPGNNSLKSPLLGLHTHHNMDFQLNIFGYKEGYNSNNQR